MERGKVFVRAVSQRAACLVSAVGTKSGLCGDSSRQPGQQSHSQNQEKRARLFLGAGSFHIMRPQPGSGQRQSPSPGDRSSAYGRRPLALEARGSQTMNLQAAVKRVLYLGGMI